MAHRLICPLACGISVPGPGINPHTLHCKADSLPLGRQGSPLRDLNFKNLEYLEFQKFRNYYPPALISVSFHTVKGFGIVNKAEIDVFLKLSCFFDDPVDVGNLISGSSAFSKTSFNIWKFMVHILLKPSLENFEHYFTSM